MFFWTDFTAFLEAIFLAPRLTFAPAVLLMALPALGMFFWTDFTAFLEAIFLAWRSLTSFSEARRTLSRSSRVSALRLLISSRDMPTMALRTLVVLRVCLFWVSSILIFLCLARHS